MPDKKDKVDTTKRGYRDELRKRAIKKAMPKKKKSADTEDKPAKTEASAATKVTLSNIVKGIRKINEYFEGAAQETLA